MIQKSTRLRKWWEIMRWWSISWSLRTSSVLTTHPPHLLLPRNISLERRTRRTRVRSSRSGDLLPSLAPRDLTLRMRTWCWSLLVSLLPSHLNREAAAAAWLLLSLFQSNLSNYHHHHQPRLRDTNINNNINNSLLIPNSVHSRCLLERKSQ